MSFYDKYLKYKTKYISLKNQKGLFQIGGSKIDNIKESSVSINIIEGASKSDIELIIIPGFSTSSYDRNYKTLFEYYDIKLDIKKFNKIHLVKFQDDEEFSIRTLHGELLKEDVNLENKLYEKLAEIINNKLKPATYTILAKSAGGGVAIYLSELIPKQIKKLLLFAPGVGYINNDLETLTLKESKIIVGWNKEDTKVHIGTILPILQELLPNTEVLLYTKDIKDDVDTQHEINSKFIENVY